IYDWGNDDIGDVTFCLSTPNTLSTSSFETNSIFNYYPNPVKNTLSLNAKEAITNVLIFNILGREVVKINTNTVSKNVDMSSLKSGIYFVQVTIGETVETVRIIKN
uniref:T9SS type A sorting domain-containing protein n=1 Tax=Lacinutrix sp. TaxID=1937692 RepID=UPI0025C4283D